MKKQLIMFFIAIAMILSINSFSQSIKTVIYSSSSLNSSSTCNVFNQSGNNPTVGGLAHWPVSGGATFNGTSILMKSTKDPANNIDNGTAYAIEYNFKVGYNYTLSLDISSSNFNTNSPIIKLSTLSSLPSPGSSNPTDCGPVGRNFFSSSFGELIFSFNPDKKELKTYNSPSAYSPSIAKNYLSITVSDGASTGTTVSIDKIIITESSPTPSFTLTPATVTKNCGTAHSQSFTINNVNNSTGTVLYQWNLGANNGWLYNGVAAPASITTASNTLALTAATCGTALQNVNGTAILNGTNYNTNACVITNTTLPLSINGDASFCTTSTPYTITNLGCNATVTWSASPSGVITINSPNAISTTLSKVANGNITLTATINNNCGNGGIITLTKPIAVGSSTPTYIDGITNGQIFAPNSYYNFSSNGIDWSPSGGSIFSGQGTNDVMIKTVSRPPGTANYIFDVKVRQFSCGSYSSYLVRSGWINPNLNPQN